MIVGLTWRLAVFFGLLLLVPIAPILALLLGIGPT